MEQEPETLALDLLILIAGDIAQALQQPITLDLSR